MAWNNVKQTQVLGTPTTITTTVSGGANVRVLGFSMLTSGTAGGHIEFKDLAGNVLITENAPTATNSWLYIKISDEGVRFQNGLVVSAPSNIIAGVYTDAKG